MCTHVTYHVPVCRSSRCFTQLRWPLDRHCSYLVEPRKVKVGSMFAVWIFLNNPSFLWSQLVKLLCHVNLVIVNVNLSEIQVCEIVPCSSSLGTRDFWEVHDCVWWTLCFDCLHITTWRLFSHFVVWQDLWLLVGSFLGEGWKRRLERQDLWNSALSGIYFAASIVCG